MTRTPPVTCQADIDAMTQEQARQWLIANDREAADYWTELPDGTDFREAVSDNCRDFGFDEPVPPDPDGMNKHRSGIAGDVIAAFMKRTGADEEDALGDLLADLMHWADRAGFDFDLALERARGHYEADTTAEAA